MKKTKPPVIGTRALTGSADLVLLVVTRLYEHLSAHSPEVVFTPAEQDHMMS